MKPDSKLLTDISNGVDGVKSPVHRGAGGAVDEERREASLFVLQQELLQVAGTHPALAVNIHIPAVGSAKTQRGGGALQAVVALTRMDNVGIKQRLQLKA